MDMLTLHTELASKGIVLSLDTERRIKYAAPVGSMTAELTAAIREHKSALLAQLERTAEPRTERNRRPGADDLAQWNAYYSRCTWYAGKNVWNDNPVGLALEYACLDHAGSYTAFLSRSLFRFYANCKAAHILDEPEPIEPRQYTERLRSAYERKDGAAIRKLAEPFHRSEQITEILSELQNTAAAGSVPRQGRQDEQITPEPLTESRKTRESARTRVTVYVDVSAGRGVTDTGAALSFPASCSLSELAQNITAAGCEPDRIFICGARPGADYASWLIDSGMFAAYTTAERGHYFDEKEEDNHVARWQHRASGRVLEVRRIVTWFGDECTPELAQAAMSLLSQYVQKAFAPDVQLYATPALTFQALWTRQNRIAGKAFPLLPPEIRQLIRETSGQGRIELLTLDKLKNITELDYYDGRFMYAALTWGMPTELAAHDFDNSYAGKVPARYRIRFTIPENWRHIGLFMVPKDAVTGNARDKGAWLFPGDTYAGQTFETWADGAELDAAYNLPAGMPRWNIEILERIVFKTDRESAVNKPLDTITEKLVKLREQITKDESADAGRAEVYKLVAGAVRNILLHGIGSFHRHERNVTILAKSNEAPDGYIHMSPGPIYDDVYAFQVPQSTERYTQQFEHPEYSALIWARCRARMTRAALSVPREQIIAIRTDAIALCAEHPAWNENERIGQLRRKWVIKRNLKAPHDFETLDKYIN